MAFSRRHALRSGAVLVSGWVCERSLPGETRSHLAQSNDQSWALENDLIRRDVGFRPGVGLYTARFFDKSTSVDLLTRGGDIAKARPEFSFNCDGKPCASNGGDFELVAASPASASNSKCLSVRMKHKNLPLEVIALYLIYTGHAASRKSLSLRNTGNVPLTITHLIIETMELTLGPENEMTLWTQYGSVPREIFYTGRSEDAAIMVVNARTGHGVAILNEVPGYMKRTEVAGWDAGNSIRVSGMYDTDLMPFERRLAAREEFTTASISLLPFKRDDGFNDPRWRVPSYSAGILERRIDSHGPPWIYNTWEPFERSINQEISMELIDAAGAMGMDIFTIDDGWQQEYGDNDVNLTAFPGGLDPILKAVEAKGMRLGLWIPAAAIGTTTQVYKAHPEWAALDLEGNTKTTSTMAGQKAVMCMASPFRHTAAARINDAIQRFRLAYVKLDLTTIFNAYGEAPGCWAKGHDHADWAESLNRIYEGIKEMTAEVYAKHPDVLLDLTFELWGQKHIIDAGLLAAGDLDWMSNVDDTRPDSAGPLQVRQLLYARAASMPVEAMLIGNLHADLPTIQESFATTIGSAPLLLGDLRKLTPADRVWYREKIAWFRQLRKRVKLSESFFPLGSWRQTSPVAWDGFARLAKSGDGVVALFRNKSGATEARVELSLIPGGQYRARSVITGKNLGTFDQAAWKNGVRIAFPGQIELVELQRL
ncbi:MAG TPA: alpha-galactosidase [Terracidiphilus sp.]|nr:alpha-galactosidase [Terracidiphilus sp.]